MLRIVALILGFVSLSCRLAGLRPGDATGRKPPGAIRSRELQGRSLRRRLEIQLALEYDDLVHGHQQFRDEPLSRRHARRRHDRQLHRRRGDTRDAAIPAQSAAPMPFSVNPMQGPPRGAFVPAGARAAGAIVVYNCPAPNPGYPTAPLSISLLVGKSQSFQTMTTFPLSVDAPIRQLQSQ